MSKLKTCVLGVAGLTLLLVLGSMVDSRKRGPRNRIPGQPRSTSSARFRFRSAGR